VRGWLSLDAAQLRPLLDPDAGEQFHSARAIRAKQQSLAGRDGGYDVTQAPQILAILLIDGTVLPLKCKWVGSVIVLSDRNGPLTDLGRAIGR
jgi:hypothetical protein